MNIKKYYKTAILVCITLICVTVFILLATRTSVFHKQKKDDNVKKNAEVALIYNDSTDSYSKSMIMKGISSAAKTLNKKYGSYSCNDYKGSVENTISSAVQNGATLLIFPDDSFEEAIYAAQNTYVNTYFMIIDGIPHNKDSSDSVINYNVIPLSYDESEAGFLAGYSAVYEGYTDFAFVGDDTLTSKHYNYGILQGADYAAKNLNKNNITIHSSYLKDVDDATDIANKLFDQKAQLIIANNDSIIDDIIEVGESEDKPVITCNSNYLGKSDIIQGSVIRNLTPTINDSILNFYNGSLKGGAILKLDASNNGIVYDYNKNSFKYFTETIYKDIFSCLTGQNIKIISDTTVAPSDLGLTNVTLIN